MGLKICEECGEHVDQAKAFCPDCGNPFVEEKKREESSEYDSYAGTIKVSKSMYKMMLSEMELDTSVPPQKDEQKHEPSDNKPEPIEKNVSTKESPKDFPQVKERPQAPRQQKIQKQERVPKQEIFETKKNSASSNKKMIFLAVGGGLVLISLLFIGVLSIVLYFYLR